MSQIVSREAALRAIVHCRRLIDEYRRQIDAGVYPQYDDNCRAGIAEERKTMLRIIAEWQIVH